jgi:hypothetical protein
MGRIVSMRARVALMLLSILVAACSAAERPPGGAATTAASPGAVVSTSAGTVVTPASAAPAPTTAAQVLPSSDGEGSGPASTVAPHAFDYETAAAYQRTSETGMGRIAWYKTSVVPSEWLYSGFPTPSFVADPFGYDRSWARVADAAECCHTITRTDDGWIGVGPAGVGSSACAAPLAVWHSPNGVDWEVMTAAAFGDDGPCSAVHLVEHGGSAAFFAGGRGGEVWVSHGLEHWIRASFLPHEEGTDTFITAIVAGPAGFAAFGVRVAHEPTARSETGIRLGPYPMEWVGWTSSDGLEWRVVNMARMFGTPWCKPNHPVPCGYIDAMMTHDGIIAYIHQAADSTVPDMRDGWALWIGLVE